MIDILGRKIPKKILDLESISISKKTRGLGLISMFEEKEKNEE